jgi:ABC-type multidrug transport system permease subunit
VIPVLRLAANDVRLTVRDRAAAFWLLILPVFLIWIFGRVMGGGGTAAVALTVIDRDGEWLAQAFAEELAAPNVKLTVLRGADADGDAAKKATRWIELPSGFTADVLAGRQQKLKIRAAEDAAADYSRAADVVVARGIVRTLGRVAEMKSTQAELSGATYDTLRARPPLVALLSANAGRGTAVTGMEQSVPGNMTFTVMMMTLIYGAVFLTIEKREGMLKRKLTLPISRSTIFAGTVLGRVLVALLQIAILVAVGRFLFHLDFGRSPAGLWLILTSYAIAVAGIATFLGAVLASPEQASTVGWLASTVMGALGGCWWPAEVMPDWLRACAHVFPTAWAMDGLHALISFGKGFDAIVIPAAVLLAFGVGFSWLAARKLRLAVE